MAKELWQLFFKFKAPPGMLAVLHVQDQPLYTLILLYMNLPQNEWPLQISYKNNHPIFQLSKGRGPFHF